MKYILEVKDLRLKLSDKGRDVEVLKGLDLELKPNEVLGIVGESGCGKTMTALSLTGLLPKGSKATCRHFSFDGKTIDYSNLAALERIRAGGISYVFQEAVSYIDPLFTVGGQVTETIAANRGLDKGEAKKEALSLLEEVGLFPAQDYYNRFAHQLSGGMNQRIMIAMAISSGPKILIADEPTTALDVTVEHQIVLLIQRLIKELGLSVIWITHDISLIQGFADRLAVMHDGRIVEAERTSLVYNSPQHPYTKALIGCLPENLKKRR